jgi:ribonuclease HII
MRLKVAAQILQSKDVVWSLGWAQVDEIDSINILNATFLAMRRAVEGLWRAMRSTPGVFDARLSGSVGDSLKPELWIDGNQRLPGLELPFRSWPQTTVVKGDSKVPEISAASVLAKVARDEYIKGIDFAFPGFGLAKHKGYLAPQHLAALKEQGPCWFHRKSFSPVKEMWSERLEEERKSGLGRDAGDAGSRAELGRMALRSSLENAVCRS